MKRIIFFLAVMTILSGVIACTKTEETPQSVLTAVTMNLIPDYSDGTIANYNPMTNCMYLTIEVTPAKYAEELADTNNFIHKVVFSPVRTKADFGNAFTITPSSIMYNPGAPIPFLDLYLELNEMEVSMLKNGAYSVSCSIEDKDGIHGASTAFVSISNSKSSEDVQPENYIDPLIEIISESADRVETKIIKEAEGYENVEDVQKIIEEAKKEISDVRDAAISKIKNNEDFDAVIKELDKELMNIEDRAFVAILQAIISYKQIAFFIIEYTFSNADDIINEAAKGYENVENVKNVVMEAKTTIKSILDTAFNKIFAAKNKDAVDTIQKDSIDDINYAVQTAKEAIAAAIANL